MRKPRLTLLIALLAMPALFGQIKIGDNPQTISPTSVLELESNDRVLVITRIDTNQMNAIVPDQGAMVYNTDTQCIHYYDGTQWINLCNSAGLEFTTDPIVNAISTIVITDQAGTKNFEVAPSSIGTEQIINGGINGVDIQDGSIGPGKLQNQSVTQDKLSENSVGAFALDNANINLSDFNNDLNLLTISTAPGNDIVDNGGAFYDNQPLQDAIGTNTVDIQNHIAADADTNVNNELQTLSFDNATNELTITLGNTVTLPSGGNPNDELITDAQLSGTDLIITDPGQTWTIPLGGLSGGNPNLTDVLTQGNDAGAAQITNLADPTLAQDAATKAYVDANIGGNQNLDQVLTQGNDGGAALIKNIGDPVDPQDAATKAYVDVNIGGSQNLDQVLTQGSSAGNQQINDLLDPTLVQDAATKGYVDAAVTAGGSLLDGSILIGGVGDVAQQLPISGDATMDNTGVLTIEPNAVDSGKIDNDAILLEDLNQNGAADGQIIKWNNTSGLWEIADDDTGTATLTDGNIFVGDAANTPADVTMSGDATIDNTGALTIQDDAIELNMIDQNGATDGQIMEWDDTAGEWIVTDPSGHNGTAKAIFFADTDGTPTTADDNANPNDDGGLIWDTDARPVGALTYGALLIGKQAGSPPVGNHSKVVITERIANSHPTQAGLAFPLQLQNENGANSGNAASGILFAVEPAGDFGKGGLVYERQGAWGVGDFHFLQNTQGNNTIPVITEKAFTIRNNSDIVLYGGIDINGIGTGMNGQVLTSTGTGVQWGTGGSGETNTASNVGVGGEGLFFQKTGANLEFKNINGLDANIITVTDDAVNNEIDLDIRDESIDPTTKIVPESAAPSNDKMLITDTSGNVVWDDVPTGTGNLSTDNLTQDAGENRTYNLNNQDLMFIGTGGNIGIGDFGGGILPALPEDKLDVDGQVRARNGFAASPGSAALPSYGFYTNNDNGTGMFRAANMQLGFSTGGVQAVQIDASQNVGIGTTTPAQKLHVAGTTQSEGILNSNGSVNNPSYSFSGDTDSGVFHTGNNDEFTLVSGGVGALTIDAPSSGNTNVIVNQSLELEGVLLDGASNPGGNGQVLTSTVTGTQWADPSGLPTGGTNGQVLATDGAVTPTYSWVNNDDDQNATEVNLSPAIDVDYDGSNENTVQEAIADLSANKIIAKGRVAAGGGTGGAYTEPAPGLLANDVINLTVEQTVTGNPIMIQLVGRTATNFSVQIYEWNPLAGAFVGTNAVWNYTIVNQ